MGTTSRSSNLVGQSVRLLLGLGAGVAGGLGLLATPDVARAQAAAPGASDQLEEIVVTAERTESTVQRTPISLIAVSGEDLKNNAILNLASLTQVEPTVVFNQGQFNGASASIRGVSSASGAAVTINVDGQYIIAGFNPALYDIARVEVLKGPQGTLYGQNSTAGNINIVTSAPRLGEQTLDASLGYGNYNLRSFDGALNLPLGDTAALRFAVVSNTREGYRDHPGMDSTDYADINAIRASWLWRPNEKASVRLTGEYSDEDFGGPAQQGVRILPSALTPAGQAPVNFTSANLDPKNWGLAFEGYNHARVTSVRGNVDYDLGWATLTYLGSYRYRTNPFFHSAFGTPVQTTDFQSVHNWAKTNQQELRLNNTTDFGLKWQVGLYYLKNDVDSLVNIFSGATALSPVRTVPQIIFTIPNNKQESKAVYGQFTQSVTERLSLTAGLRHTDVDQSNLPNNVSNLNFGPYFGSGGTNISYTTANTGGVNKFKKTTYRAGVDFQATEKSLIYGSVATSFKDGGFTSFNSFLPEEITAYEIGSKNRFLGDTVQLNGAVYYYDYKNQQQTLFVIQPNGLAASTTVNAGATGLKGAEANLVWAISDATRFTSSASFTDSKFKEFNAAMPIVPLNGVSAVNTSLRGKRPPNAPKLTFTAGLEHTWRLEGGASLTGSVDMRYLSSYYLSVFNMSGQRVDNFMQSNAGLTYRAGSGMWDISAYVRNIEDNTVLNFAQYLTQGPNNIYMFGWEAPRTYGARLSVRLK